MNHLARRNGTQLAPQQPRPQPREPERVRVPEREPLPEVYNVRSVIIATVVCVVAGGIVMALIAFAMAALLIAAAGG